MLVGSLHVLRWFLAVPSLLFLMGCSGDATTSSELTVGPQGGEFTFLDGRLVVTVPPGAVATATRLTVQSPLTVPASPLLVPGTALELGPSTLVLASPISVRVNYATFAPQIPVQVRARELRLGRVVGAAWTYPPGAVTVDTLAQRLTAEIETPGIFALLGPPVHRVEIVAPPTGVAIGGTAALIAQALDDRDVRLEARTIQWSSLDPGTATVNGATGVVTGVAVGTARIVATAETRADTAQLSVTAGAPPAPAIVEDFSTYATFAEFLTDPRGIYITSDDGRTDRMAFDAGVRFGNSTRSLRYDYPAGTATDYTIARRLRLPTNTSEVWVEAVVRFSNNFTLNGNGQGAGAAFKLLHVGIPDGPGGRFGVNFEGGDASVLRAEGPNDAYEALYFFTSVTSSTLFNGQWHTLRYHVRAGAVDFHEVWINGAHQGSASGNSAASRVIAVSLAQNLNMLAASPQQMWWGKVTVWTQNPGW